MRTDYGSVKFVGQYARRRALSGSAVRAWAEQLSHQTTSTDVRRVLDVGSGLGRFWPAFEAAWSPCLIVAVDSSLPMLNASPAASNLARVAGDIDALPFKRGAGFDVAFCSMSLHYSSDPRACVESLAVLVRPGGWILVRTGTHETLRTFDFLRFFPTARRAELRAMPADSALYEWFRVDGLEIRSVVRVAGGPVPTRRAALGLAYSRGFPSLQLVPPVEWLLGTLRYAAHLSLSWLGNDTRPTEESVLVAARRTL